MHKVEEENRGSYSSRERGTVTDANYYKGIFVTMNEGQDVYYCYSCVVIGGELDVNSNTIAGADMIIGMMNNSVVIITRSEKVILGRDELYELLNGEVSKVYGELPAILRGE